MGIKPMKRTQPLPMQPDRRQVNKQDVTNIILLVMATRPPWMRLSPKAVRRLTQVAWRNLQVELQERRELPCLVVRKVQSQGALLFPERQIPPIDYGYHFTVPRVLWDSDPVNQKPRCRVVRKARKART